MKLASNNRTNTDWQVEGKRYKTQKSHQYKAVQHRSKQHSKPESVTKFQHNMVLIFLRERRKRFLNYFTESTHLKFLLKFHLQAPASNVRTPSLPPLSNLQGGTEVPQRQSSQVTWRAPWPTSSPSNLWCRTAVPKPSWTSVLPGELFKNIFSIPPQISRGGIRHPWS